MALCLFSLLFLSGCAETKYVFNYANEDAKELLWPKEEQIARYRYVGQLLGEQNLSSDSDGGFAAVLIDALKWVAGVFSASGGSSAIVLQRPQGGTTDANGRIYVADASRQAIYVFDPVTAKLHVWDDAGSGGFVSPVSVVVLGNGEVLVSDAQLAAVIRLDSNGVPLGFFAAGIMERPTGLAYDATRNLLYIADSAAHDIKVFRRDGTFVKRLGGPGVLEGQFNGPTHLSYRDNKLYVTDSLNARVQIFDGEGLFLSTFGERGVYVGNMPRPKGVAADSDGNVYVVESYQDHMLVFDEEGEFLMPLGGTGHGIGQFYLPAGIWIDAQDRVYIADMFNGRVVIFQYLGQEGVPVKRPVSTIIPKS